MRHLLKVSLTIRLTAQYIQSTSNLIYLFMYLFISSYLYVNSEEKLELRGSVFIYLFLALSEL